MARTEPDQRRPGVRAYALLGDASPRVGGIVLHVATQHLAGLQIACQRLAWRTPRLAARTSLNVVVVGCVGINSEG